MRVANCHPDQKYFARGLCHQCYRKEYYKENVTRWREYGRANYAANRERETLRQRQNNRLYLYGVSAAEFNKLLAEQNGCCAICGCSGANHLDHNHATGKVRGVLCRTCNLMLGNAKDDVKVLQAAQTYLEDRNG